MIGRIPQSMISTKGFLRKFCEKQVRRVKRPENISLYCNSGIKLFLHLFVGHYNT